MPLKSGKSRRVFTGNVQELIKSGRPMNQALAIAYSMKEKYGKGKKKKSVGIDTSKEIDTWQKGGKVYQEMGPGNTKPRLLGPAGRSYAGINQSMPAPTFGMSGKTDATRLPARMRVLGSVARRWKKSGKKSKK